MILLAMAALVALGAGVWLAYHFPGEDRAEWEESFE